MDWCGLAVLRCCGGGPVRCRFVWCDGGGDNRTTRLNVKCHRTQRDGCWRCWLFAATVCGVHVAVWRWKTATASGTTTAAGTTAVMAVAGAAAAAPRLRNQCVHTRRSSSCSAVSYERLLTSRIGSGSLAILPALGLRSPAVGFAREPGWPPPLLIGGLCWWCVCAVMHTAALRAARAHQVHQVHERQFMMRTKCKTESSCCVRSTCGCGVSGGAIFFTPRSLV